MELLLEIKVDELPQEKTYKTRNASRAVLFDEQNLVPLLFVSQNKYHKLPGGGIDTGEDKEQALRREVLEEVGSTISITGEVGKIIEYRSKFNLLQTSYGYMGKIITKGQPHFTEEELQSGFQIVWLSLEEAINKITHDKPEGYEGFFIQKRDLKFLQKAKELMNQK